jgi:hypothetical protein
VTVDLDAREVRAQGVNAPFELDENVRWRLLNGLDDISITLQQEADISRTGQTSRPPNVRFGNSVNLHAFSDEPSGIQSSALNCIFPPSDAPTSRTMG